MLHCPEVLLSRCPCGVCLCVAFWWSYRHEYDEKSQWEIVHRHDVIHACNVVWSFAKRTFAAIRWDKQCFCPGTERHEDVNVKRILAVGNIRWYIAILRHRKLQMLIKWQSPWTDNVVYCDLGQLIMGFGRSTNFWCVCVWARPKCYSKIICKPKEKNK